MISVPEPCHEDWNNMTPDEQGRHCQSCSKLVHDFTSSSADQIVAAIQNSASQVCGRFTKEQIRPSFQWNIPILSKFCFVLLLVFGTQLFSGNETFGQIKSEEKDGVTIYYSDSTAFEVRGTVVDEETREPLPFAHVFIDLHGEHIATTTDFDGKFKMQINKGQVIMLEHFDLNVSFVGYTKMQVQNIPVTKGKFIDMGTIEMSGYGELLLGMVISVGAPVLDKDPDAHRKTTFDRKDVQNFPRY